MLLLQYPVLGLIVDVGIMRGLLLRQVYEGQEHVERVLTATRGQDFLST